MTNQEIIEFINQNLRGQGTAVDLSCKLPEILGRILQQITDMGAGKVDTDTVKAAAWLALHPEDALYLANYTIGGEGYEHYLQTLASEWSEIGSSGHLDVPWGPNEMVSIIAIDTTEATFGGYLKFIRNGKLYILNTSGDDAWTIEELADQSEIRAIVEEIGTIGSILDIINGEEV